MDYLNTYTELQHIGKGSYGEVFLIRHNTTNDYLISKKIHLDSMDASEQQKVKQEIFLMQRFSHPCIVKYIESFIEQTQIIIVMENCPGGDLDQLIHAHKASNSHFPESCLMEWTLQLVSALNHVHSLKIIHRDLKPSNIFLTLDGKLKLGDFGVSKALVNTNDVALTQIGTPLFMSPEACNNQPYTYKCDLWALGCILYELATFKKPFLANSFLALAMKILDHDPDPLPSSYSQKFSDLVFCLLTKNPADRLSSRQVFSFLGVKDPFLSARVRNEERIYDKSVEKLDFESTVGNVQLTDDYFSDFESDSEEYEEDFEI